MIVAIISFDGIALAWFHYTNNLVKFHDWNDLKGRLRDRFYPTKEDNVPSCYPSSRRERSRSIAKRLKR